MVDVKEVPKPKTDEAKGQGESKDVALRQRAVPIQDNRGPFGFMGRFAGQMVHLFEDFGSGFSLHVVPTGLNNKQEDRAMTSTSTSTQRPHRWIPTRTHRRCFQAAIAAAGLVFLTSSPAFSQQASNQPAGSRSAARQARKQKPVADTARIVARLA